MDKGEVVVIDDGSGGSDVDRDAPARKRRGAASSSSSGGSGSSGSRASSGCCGGRAASDGERTANTRADSRHVPREVWRRISELLGPESLTFRAPEHARVVKAALPDLPLHFRGCVCRFAGSAVPQENLWAGAAVEAMSFAHSDARQALKEYILANRTTFAALSLVGHAGSVSSALLNAYALTDLTIELSNPNDHDMLHLALRMEWSPLKRLEVQGRAPAQGCSTFATGLTRNSTLETLVVGKYALNVHGANAIGKALTFPGCALRRLEIRAQQRIEDAGAAAIMAGARANTSLRALALRDIGARLTTFRALAVALRSPTVALQELDVFDATDTLVNFDMGFAQVVRALQENDSLRRLKIPIEVRETSANALHEFTKSRRSGLQEVRFTRTFDYSGHLAVEAFLRGIATHGSGRLRRLVIDDCNAREVLYLDTAMISIADYLGLILARSDTLLEDLSVRCALFVVTPALGRGLCHNRTLRSLHLDVRGVRGDACVHLGELIASTRLALRKISFAFAVGMARCADAQILDGLKENRALLDLCTRWPTLSCDALGLIEALQSPTCPLRFVRLSNNREMGDSTGAQLLRAVKDNKTLVKLDMARCGLGSDSVRALTELLTGGALDSRRLEIVLDGNPRMADDRKEAVRTLRGVIAQNRGTWDACVRGDYGNAMREKK